MKGRSIWRVAIPHDATWTWRKILQVREEIRGQIVMQVGDGRQTSLFFDTRLNIRSIDSLIRSRAALKRWGDDLKVADWWENGRLNIPPSFVSNFPEIATAIQSKQLNADEDTTIWKPHSCARFTIASCYEHLRYKREKVEWRNLVWSPSNFPRHAFCLWLAVLERLNTRAALERRGICNGNQCVFCNRDRETCSHLFFGCAYTRAVWRNVLRNIGIVRNLPCWNMEQRWLLQRCRGHNKNAKLIQRACVTTVYEVWQERNRRIFVHEQKDIPYLV